ncbi:HEAT repeat-containing protein 5B [Diaphorina citri]|uniref:HEAT repeat-containing protein 5B n=1 Tax=Diaphorina citri TaxID=121845 RepID=A0A3Q0IQI8_DIACI|nr:HEAT repeat-containing protein 5B [Diaphorina citri]
MELSHSLTLNEEALLQIPEAQQPMFIFEWLRFLDKVLVAAQKSDIKGCQKKLVQQLTDLIEKSQGPPTRKLIASCLSTLFSVGDTFLLFDTVNKCNDILKNKDDSPSLVNTKLAAMCCVGSMYEKLGRMMGRSYEETVHILIKSLKSADSQTRIAIMQTLEKILLLWDWFYFQCLLEMVKHATDMESLATLCFRALDGSNYEVRLCIAKLLGALVASTQHQPKGNTPMVSQPSNKNVKTTTLEEALGVLQTGFLKGGGGFLKGTGEIIKGTAGVNREVRVGVTHAYVEFIKIVGGPWLERNLSPVLNHILELVAKVAQPKVATSHVDAVYSRKCVSFILRSVLGKLLSEKAQTSALKEITLIVTKHLAVMDVSSDSKDYHQETAFSQHLLVCALQEMSSLILGLGTTANNVLSDKSCNLLETVMISLIHPSQAVRLASAWCLRCICVAVPSQCTPLIDRCIECIEMMKNSPEAISGYSYALAAVLGGVKLSCLGIPHTKGKVIFNTAEELLRSANQNSRLSLHRTQAGWLLIGAIITLGVPVVRKLMPRMLLLWRNSFPQSKEKLDSEKERGEAFTWQVTLEGRAGALSAMYSFAYHCPELLTPDHTRRLLVPISKAIEMMASIGSVLKTYGQNLKAPAAMVRLRLYETLSLLSSQCFEDKYLFFSLQTVNSVAGSGALEHDICCLYRALPEGETIPGPLPLGIAVVDASVVLFGSLFPKDARCKTLDAKVSMDELHEAILKMKSGKSPGPDGILSEQLKNLSIYWLNELRILFDDIMENNNVPQSLAKLDMVMIFKKGDKNLPENYRSIALLNNIFKIFTHILADRIYTWAEENSVINEGQMGFRRKRGCVDGIFVLSSIVHLRMRSMNRMVYAVFIDFQRAFSSVPHDKMWKALFKLGLSGNIIRTIATLYLNTRARVRTQNGEHTKEVKITRGLLEGDPLSALLFILYITDMEDFLRERGIRGVSVNNSQDLLLLMYADDLVLLADSRVQLQNILNLLEIYCDEKGLTVNVKKSNVVIFKQGRRSAQDTFRYKGEEVEVKNTFTYLGVMFSSSGLFLQAASQAVMKASVASSSIIKTLIKTRSQSWETKIHLFETIAKSTLLYAAEVWSHRYLEEVERCQMRFYKTVLQISRSTPGYIVRCELGITKIAYYAIKQTIIWWIKILSMPEHRYPKICYYTLMRRHTANPDMKYNWVTQLHSILREAGKLCLWESQDPELVKTEIDSLLDFYKQKYIMEDENRRVLSSYSVIYKTIADGHTMKSYLNIDCPIQVTRTFSQLRAAGANRVYINLKGNIHSWNTTELCTMCNLAVLETLQHVICECPMYADVRSVFLKPILDQGNTLEQVLFNVDCSSMTSKLYAIHNFVCEAMKIRAFRTLSSSHLLLRKAAVSCLRQLTQREAKEVCEHALILIEEKKDFNEDEKFASQLPHEGGAFYTSDTMDSCRSYYSETWPAVLHATSLWLNNEGKYFDVNATERKNSDTETFHLMFGAVSILPTLLYLLTGIIKETATKTAQDNSVLASKPSITAALHALKTLCGYHSSMPVQVKQQWNSLLQSALAKVIDLAKTVAGTNETKTDEVTMMLALAVFILHVPSEVIAAPNLQYPCINHFRQCVQSENIQVWSLHALSLIADSGGPMFRGYVENALSLAIKLLLTVPQSFVDVHQCIGKVLSALITTVGPELQGNSRSISMARSSFLCACTMMQDHDDPSVQAEAIACLQQLHLFAPRHVNLSSLVPTLCRKNELKTLASHWLNVLKDYALLSLPPDTLVMTETGLPGMLFNMLNTETDSKLIKYTHDTLISMLNMLAADNLSPWLSLIKSVLTVASDASINEDTTSTGGTSHSSHLNIEDDEHDDADDDQSEFHTEEKAHVNIMPRWPTRVFAAECVRKIIAVCMSAVPGPNPHFDLALAKELVATKNKSDYLVLHLSELVRMAFMAATSDSDPLRLEGLHTLKDIIDRFSGIPEPEFPGHLLLEQYQAQVGAALRPAFSPDTASHVTAAACKVCSSWIGSGVARDLNDLRRVHQLLVSSLVKLSGPHRGNPIYNESLTTLETLAILKAWAEVYVVAMTNNGPLPLRGPLQGPLPHEGGAFYTSDTMDSCRSYYSETWPAVLHATSLWLNNEGKYFDVNATERKNSDTETFHLMFGICMEALCNTQILENTDIIVTSLKALYTLLDSVGARQILTANKSLPIELCNVIHRLILTKDSGCVQEIAMKVVKQIVQAVQEDLDALKKKKLRELAPANQEQLASEEIELLGEGGSNGTLKPGESIVFSLLEVCLCLVVRRLPALNPTPLVSPIFTKSLVQNEESGHVILATAINVMQMLPRLCSPHGKYLYM